MIFETINKQKGEDLLGEYAEGLTNDRNLRGGKSPRSEQHRDTRMTFVKHPDDAGVIGDPVGNRHRRTRGIAASTEPTGGAKKNTADHRRAQDSQEGV